MMDHIPVSLGDRQETSDFRRRDTGDGRVNYFISDSGTLIFNFSGQRSHVAGHKEKELNKWENINNKHTFKLPSKTCKKIIRQV